MSFTATFAASLADELGVERWRITPLAVSTAGVVAVAVAPPFSAKLATAQTLAIQAQVLLRSDTSSFYSNHPSLAASIDMRVEPVSLIGRTASSQKSSFADAVSSLTGGLTSPLALWSGGLATWGARGLAGLATVTLVGVAIWGCCRRNLRVQNDPQELAALTVPGEGEHAVRGAESANGNSHS